MAAEMEEQVSWDHFMRLVGRRGGRTTMSSTPVASFTRISDESEYGVNEKEDKDSRGLSEDNGIQFPCVSSRKLGAALWELHHYRLPLYKVGMPHPRFLVIKVGSSSSSKRYEAASLKHHHPSIENSSPSIEAVSPASNASSVEVQVKPQCLSLRASVELLKVLRCVWRLEEQHVSNASLIKALKEEIEGAHTQIRELVRQQQVERHEMDELIKHIREDKLARKNEEQAKINAAVQSMSDKLEKERESRKSLEIMCTKLATELYVVKTYFASMCKEIEKERKHHELLGQACDLLPWGVRDYTKELNALRKKSGGKWGKTGTDNQLILQMFESWLEESSQDSILQSPHCLQMKFQEQISLAITHADKTIQVEDAEQVTELKGNTVETRIAQKPDYCGKYEPEGTNKLYSSYEIDDLMINHFSLRKRWCNKDYRVASTKWSSSSSTCQSTEKLSFEDPDISGASSKLPPRLKENTLNSKLSKARKHVRRTRCFLKASIVPSRNVRVSRL